MQYLLFWSVLNLISVNGSLVLTAVTQIISEVESSEFKGLGKCDLFLLGMQRFMMASFLESSANPLILVQNSAADGNVFSQLLKAKSTCVILLMAAKNSTETNFVTSIISSRTKSIVINIVNQKQINQMWKQQDSDMFPRNIVELRADKTKSQVSLSITCTQNMGHLTMQDVNLWISHNNQNQLPAKPLAETMPNHICPHPLYKKKLRIGYWLNRPLLFPSKSAEYGLSGVEMSLLKLLRDKFKFGVSFLEGTPGEYNFTSKQWSGIWGKLIDKELDLRFGGCAVRSIVDYTTPFIFIDLKWISRRPIPIPKYNQFLIVFSTSVWMATIATLITLSVLFALFYYVYHTQLSEQDLTGYLSTPVDFFLITFSCLMEPDPMNWFPRVSAGRLLILLWSIFCLNLNNFYLSNLRTNLMQQNYEREIDTAVDVVRRDQTVFLNTGTYNAFFKNINLKNPSLQKALLLSVDRNGLYDPIGNGAYPNAAKKGLFENGAVVVSYTLSLYDLNNNMSMSDFHISKESILHYYAAFCPRRDTAWKPDFDKSISHIFEMGIIGHFISQELPVKSSIPDARDPVDEVKPIKLEQIVTISFFLCAGLLIGIVAFVTEFLVFKH